MSIVELRKISLVGLADDKTQALADLQALGCMQLIPLASESEDGGAGGSSSEARDALKFLLSCPARRHQVTRDRDFDAVEVERKTLALKNRLADLRDERDHLEQRLRNLEPWGDLELPALEDIDGHRLWFFEVPHQQMDDVRETDLAWEIVGRDHRFSFVVVVSAHEPEGMPVDRTHTGSRARPELEERLENVIQEIDDAEAERSSMSRWCVLFAKNLAALDDRAARNVAARQTIDMDPLFALQGWVPSDRLTELETYAADHGMAMERHTPQPGEEPPSLLHNPRGLDAGEDLVHFYMVPGYWTWDPSSVVLISFAVFFGMILADAGYALILAGLLLWLWKKMGRSAAGRRFRVTCAALTAATFVYGILVGSYFGVTPEASTFLGRFQVLDLTDSKTMMAISVVIGVVHLVVANLMDAWRHGLRPIALAPVGWACMIAGGLGLAAGSIMEIGPATRIGIVVVVIGAALVLLFTGADEKPLRRVVRGLLAFTGVSKAFGDVLSYLRLFALGLATASLAMAFNDMASQIKQSLPGVGLFAALVVLLIGHAMNLVLGIASGVIHGMRLNVIEFFNWGLTEEGRRYQPFQRKERMSWNP